MSPSERKTLRDLEATRRIANSVISAVRAHTLWVLVRPAHMLTPPLFILFASDHLLILTFCAINVGSFISSRKTG